MPQEYPDPEVVDLTLLAQAETAAQPAWSETCADLNVNLLVLDPSGGVAEHGNDEVDVLLVGIAGAGTIIVEGTRHRLDVGHALVVPKGVRRGVEASEGCFAYLTCHRRRAGLWPAGVPRPDAGKETEKEAAARGVPGGDGQ